VDEGRELAKLARVQGQDFECAPWVQKARILPREQFRREVEKELTRRETEPLVILACFCNGHLQSSLLHHNAPYFCRHRPRISRTH
jgi:hypothetical protein